MFVQFTNFFCFIYRFFMYSLNNFSNHPKKEITISGDFPSEIFNYNIKDQNCSNSLRISSFKLIIDEMIKKINSHNFLEKDEISDIKFLIEDYLDRIESQNNFEYTSSKFENYDGLYDTAYDFLDDEFI